MKSKKVKSKSKRRERSRSSSGDRRSKKSRSQTKTTSTEKPKISKKTKESTRDAKPARKSRWQDADPKVTQDKETKVTPTTAPVPAKPVPVPKIREHLNDKPKIVDLLFQVFSGAALQELVPDYLKKKSTDELKKLCLEQINLMTDDVILEVISGKSSTKDEKTAQKEEIAHSEESKQSSNLQKDGTACQGKENVLGTKSVASLSENAKTSTVERKTEDASTQYDANACDVLELHTTATEVQSLIDEENQIPVTVKDEVAKALITPERDAELLELEMRARAIRSLLKARSQSNQIDEEEDT